MVEKEQNCVIGAFLTFSSMLVQKGLPPRSNNWFLFSRRIYLWGWLAG